MPVRKAKSRINKINYLKRRRTRSKRKISSEKKEAYYKLQSAINEISPKKLNKKDGQDAYNRSIVNQLPKKLIAEVVNLPNHNWIKSFYDALRRRHFD